MLNIKMNSWVNDQMNIGFVFSIKFYILEFICYAIYLNPSNPLQLNISFKFNKEFLMHHLNYSSQHFREKYSSYNTVFTDNKTESP